MRIVIFTNHFFPEDFKVNDIAFELQKLNYDVTVITAIPDYPKGKFYDGYGFFKKRREVVNGVKVIRLPIIPRGKGGAIRLVLNYISYYLSLKIFTFFHSLRNKYDAVFVHLTSPFFIGVPATYLKRKQNIPMYFWVLDLWPESLISAGGINNKFIISSQNRMVRNVYENCDKILISSKGFEKSICEKGDFKEKLVYFPNWAESVSEKTPSDFDIKTIKPFDSINEDSFIILFAGNIGEAQNLDAVLQSAIELKNHKNIKFVFVGDGRRRESLISVVQENNLQETVFFPGRFPIETMSVFMNSASVLLFSLKDQICFNLTVPAKVQFYMSQSKPILAMINGDGAALINEAKCGFSVPAGDSKSLSENILKMSNMRKEELKKLGENGEEFYKMNFTKEQRIEQLKNIFIEFKL
ncbi:MAG: glycosyltransferase family 4 protein [Treponema sp.]|nr:glycosyltransferase family 4 protein [Treponema sp.]MBQ2234719.1 glycosyltransferase family 4 protein [Treponema sp.]